MRPEPQVEAQRWLRQAQRDLEDARYAFDGERYSLACFLAQQAGEKALKAYLYAQGAETVLGHSVASLCEDATTFDGAFASLKEDIAPLDTFYLPTRYPNALPGGIPAEAYRRPEGERALSLGEEALSFVGKRMLPKREGTP